MALEAIIKRITEEIKEKDINQQNQKLKTQKFHQNLSNVCPKCGGTTWVTKINSKGERICERCSCYEIKQAREMWKSVGINSEQVKQTFNNYKEYNNITSLAKTTAIKYYTEFENIKNKRQNSIAFIGQVGSGKTHLSIALAVNFFKNKNIPVMYMPYREKITSLKQSMLDKEYYRKVISKYQKSKILLIDDLFKGKINDSDINIMFEIVDYRYMNHLPIIVSSEFTADRLLCFDGGVGSRIIEMCKDYTVEIEGEENNYRLKN